MTKRRFIAGAICPQCGALDRMVLDTEADHRECISCGFVESRPQAPSSQAPSTRVTRPRARRLDTPPETIKLVNENHSQD